MEPQVRGKRKKVEHAPLQSLTSFLHDNISKEKNI